MSTSSTIFTSIFIEQCDGKILAVSGSGDLHDVVLGDSVEILLESPILVSSLKMKQAREQALIKMGRTFKNNETKYCVLLCWCVELSFQLGTSAPEKIFENIAITQGPYSEYQGEINTDQTIVMKHEKGIYAHSLIN